MITTWKMRIVLNKRELGETFVDSALVDEIMKHSTGYYNQEIKIELEASSLTPGSDEYHSFIRITSAPEEAFMPDGRKKKVPAKKSKGKKVI